MPERYACDQANAQQIYTWLTTRGGILIWESVDLSDLGASMTTPFKGPDGEPVGKPHWKMGNTPARHITDIAEVDVTTAKEVKRFHVAVRQGGQGLVLKVTDGGSNRIHKAVAAAKAKYNKPAWYAFDYMDYENAVIFVEDARVPIAEWIKTHPPQAPQGEPACNAS